MLASIIRITGLEVEAHFFPISSPNLTRSSLSYIINDNVCRVDGMNAAELSKKVKSHAAAQINNIPAAGQPKVSTFYYNSYESKESVYNSLKIGGFKPNLIQVRTSI